MAEEVPGLPPSGPGAGDGAWAAPRLPRAAVRWGIGDFFLVFAAFVVGAVVAAAPFVRPDGTIPVTGLVASLVGQTVAALFALGAIARWRGRGTLGLDFGLALRRRDWWWVLVGLGTSLGAGLLLLPIRLLAGDDSGQEVVKQFERSQGVEQVLFAIAVVTLAPLVEELLYRGLLLRSFLRRLSPAWAVFVSAAVFGLAHVVGDPNAALVLPALLTLGVVSGIQAVRTGELSRSLFLHCGFNLLTTVQIVGVLHLLPRR